jgi:CRISPR-associated protein Cas1
MFVEYGELDVQRGGLVLTDRNGERGAIPVGGLTCLMLQPGTKVTHAAVRLAARVGCLLVWVGEGGVRLYATGQPGGARADRLLHQMAIALDERARLNVVREMFRRRFGDAAPSRWSVDQLRGLEGSRVRETYRGLAVEHGVEWHGRRYNPKNWRDADLPNQALSAATACLYGLSEAAILAAGYAPAVGFLHRGLPLSFVYDIADLFKFETVVPAAFATVADVQAGRAEDAPIERLVRHACRNAFRESDILDRIIPTIHEVLAAGGLEAPQDAPEAIAPSFPTQDLELADAGHRG